MVKGSKMSQEQKDKTAETKKKNKEITKEPKEEVKDVVVVKEAKKVEIPEIVKEKLLKLDRNIKMNGKHYPKGTEFRKGDVIKQVQAYLV